MIRVLIVDDSAVVRKTLSEHLKGYPDIEVVGCAVDPYHARDLIVKLSPDVLTLDIEMPRMDGLSFLAKLMRYHPLPVVIVSSLAPENSETAIRALELGAVDVICKPGSAYATGDIGRRIANALRAASEARLPFTLANVAPGTVLPPAAASGRFDLRTTRKVLAIGASTGGTVAIETILSSFPASAPGTVIVQHMPEQFTGPFAARLNTVCAMEVREARDRDPIVNGVALLAPGNRHMAVERSGAQYYVRIKDGPAVHHQRPSVDVLFHSVAENVGPNSVGVLLTGMGADGARGLLAMKETGADTIAQDEASCVVFGMPREAISLGAACEILPLSKIAAGALKLLEEARKRAA